MAIADLVTLKDEVIDDSRPYTIFDPNFPWKRKEVTNFIARPLLVPIFIKGKLVYKPTLDEIRSHHKKKWQRSGMKLNDLRTHTHFMSIYLKNCGS